MPCWERWRVSVDFSQADRELVEEAIRALGLQYSAALVEGKLICRTEEQLKRIKQSYAKKAALKVAKKKGWRIEQDKRNPQRLYVRR